MTFHLELAMEKKYRVGGVLGVAFDFISPIYGGSRAFKYIYFRSATIDIDALNLGENWIIDFCSGCPMSETFLHISTNNESY